jgi:hypothetical protein
LFRGTECFHFSVLGETGRVYQVRHTADFATWTPFTTVLLSNAPMPLVDTPATNAPQRFYRVFGP